MGGSASICAIRNGRSIETSMGFSPQAGLSHATRNGDLDPFVPLYLMREEGLSLDQVREGLSQRGGLTGISGLSGDVRDLEEAAVAGNPRAKLALEVLVHETRKYIGAYSAVLEGLDILAFTGGIGENGIRIRQSVCQGLEYLGIRIDPDRNQVRGRDTVISAEGSEVSVLVILANEELVIARETARLVAESGPV